MSSSPLNSLAGPTQSSQVLLPVVAPHLMPGEKEPLPLQRADQLGRETGEIGKVLAVHHITSRAKGEDASCEEGGLGDGPLAVPVKGHGRTDAVQVDALSLHFNCARPPLHAIAVHLMPASSEPPGQLIDPLFRAALDPGVDGVVDIGDLHRKSYLFTLKSTTIPRRNDDLACLIS